MSQVYFNEFDSFPARWLRNLYPSATVDDRSIADVQPDDVAGFTRVHYFAGIAGWELALSLAGWPAGREVWTGSCPCQPFSAAGKRGGAADPRHLWPAFHRLIAVCRPPVIFGEQVAGEAGRLWLTAVRADLEALGYAVGAADLCAAGIGAPHIRQRLYWGAQSSGEGSQERRRALAERTHAAISGDVHRGDVRLADSVHTVRRPVNLNRQDGCNGPDGGRAQAHGEPGARGEVCGMADTERIGIRGSGRGTLEGATGGVQGKDRERERVWVDVRSDDDIECGGVGNADSAGRKARELVPGSSGARPECLAQPGAWGDLEWLPCADGKARPTGARIHPLAYGIPGRVGQLRAYGNAIVPPLAAEFVRAFMEATT